MSASGSSTWFENDNKYTKICIFKTFITWNLFPTYCLMTADAPSKYRCARTAFETTLVYICIADLPLESLARLFQKL